MTGGIEASGWRLVYRDEPNALAKARAKDDKGAADFTYSLGLSTDKDGKVTDVRWDSVAFNAGIGSGMTLAAVNGIEYSKAALEDAIKAAKGTREPLQLMVKDFDRYRTLSLDYHDGLRYPHLERIAGKPDYLTPIFTARK